MVRLRPKGPRRPIVPGTCGLALATLLAACATDEASVDLQDPESCISCHPVHYQEWSGSTHAYATDDPIFVAMSRRGMRETGGALGDQCLRCHAPMMVREGLDMVDFEAGKVARPLRGVTCYVCHVLSGDVDTHVKDANTVLGGLASVVDGATHDSAYSAGHDRLQLQSSKTCSPCHQRTYEEWNESLYAQEDPRRRLTCGQCHMPGRDALAAVVEGAPIRRTHGHQFVGAIATIGDWPEQAEQRAAVERELDTVIAPRLCVTRIAGGVSINVYLDNAASGHLWPTRSVFNRRVWVELKGYLGTRVVFDTKVDEGQVADDVVSDPPLWILGSTALDQDGQPVQMPWRADTYERELLPVAKANEPGRPESRHGLGQTFETPLVDRIEMQVRLRPIGHRVLDALVASGDLEPALAQSVPTFTLLSTQITWTGDSPVCVE